MLDTAKAHRDHGPDARAGSGSRPRLAAVGGVASEAFAPAPMAWGVTNFIVALVRGATHHFALRVSDWLLALMLTTFGLVLNLSPDIFNGVHSFAVLAQMGPAARWSTVCLTIGTLRLAALVINGTFPVFRWSPHIRFTAALLSCFIWFQLTLGIALAPEITSALAVYPYLFLFDLYNTFLAASEAGVVERRYRNGGR